MEEITFGERFRFWCRRCGKKQKHIAAALHLDDSSVSGWATGDSKPTIDNMLLLCAELGITVAVFWGPLPEDAPAAAPVSAVD